MADTLTVICLTVFLLFCFCLPCLNESCFCKKNEIHVAVGCKFIIDFQKDKIRNNLFLFFEDVEPFGRTYFRFSSFRLVFVEFQCMKMHEKLLTVDCWLLIIGLVPLDETANDDILFTFQFIWNVCVRSSDLWKKKCIKWNEMIN